MASPDEPAQTRADALEAYDGAQAMYEHATWMYERDEQRASDAIARALGVMAVASALPAVMPFGIDQLQQNSLRSWYLIPTAVSAVLLLVSIIVGGLTCLPKRDAQPSLPKLQSEWVPWRTGHGLPAAMLYRDFAGTILDADAGDGPIAAMRRLANRRMSFLVWSVVTFMIALVVLVATEILILYGESR